MAYFARSELLKYGWVEGQGLGKNQNGIIQALKPKFKFDNTGIGHKSEFCSNWWESVYDKASNNVIIDEDSSGVSLKVLDETASIFSNKQDLKTIQKDHRSKYKSFVKTSTLENGKLIENEVNDVPKEKEVGVDHLRMSDDDLLKACGNRTAHKGARHGLGLNGKLARIARQEEEMLAGMKKKYLKEKVKTEEKKIVKTESIDIKEENTEKDKKRKRGAIDEESEEDVINEDKKITTHLLITSEGKVRLSKHQRRKARRNLNNLAHMLDKSLTFEENKVTKIEKDDTKRKNKKKKTSDQKSLDAKSTDVVIKTQNKIESLCAEMHELIQETQNKKIDLLSEELDNSCTLSEEKSKKETNEKSRQMTDDKNKLNGRRIIKKKARRIAEQKCLEFTAKHIVNDYMNSDKQQSHKGKSKKK